MRRRRRNRRRRIIGLFAGTGIIAFLWGFMLGADLPPDPAFRECVEEGGFG